MDNETKRDIQTDVAKANRDVVSGLEETKRDLKADAVEAKHDLEEGFSETKRDVETGFAEKKRDVAHMVSEGASTISDEMGKLRSELAGVMESVTRMGKDRVHAITHNDTVTQSLAAGEAAIDGLTKELRALEHDIAESTRRYPWRALGTAGLIGFFIGFLVRR